MFFIYILSAPVGLQDVCFRQTETVTNTSQTQFLMVPRFILNISRERECTDMNLTVNTPSVGATDMVSFRRATRMCQALGINTLAYKITEIKCQTAYT